MHYFGAIEKEETIATQTKMNYASLIESLECAVIVIDRQRSIELVNISAETLFRHSRRYLLGQPLANFISNKAVDKCIEDCLENGSQYTLREVAIEFDDREALVDMTLSSVTNIDNAHPSILVELTVINRISRFMKEKNQLERQQAFRLMMRGLAHEIKNPLGGIRGAAQLLDRELAEGSQKELTDILIKEADRLTRLVDRVMGSREQLKPQYLNIHEVLEHVLHVVSVKSAEPIVVERFYDPALPEIKVDKEQMIQAVLNVVGNGIEAQSGLANIRLGFMTQFERFVTLNQKMHRQVLKIKIWDSGPGVPYEIRNSIFDPLVTGRPEGSGLGLSITQEIIQRHNGAVQLESHHGKTCFSIYLPYINSESGNVSAAQENKHA